MRVLVLVPLTGLHPGVVARREASLRAVARPGTEVAFRVVGGPVSIESRYEEALAAAAIVEAVRTTVPESEWDAIIVWCAADPGVSAAREISSLPVVGPGEAACALASLLSHRFVTISAVEGDRLLAEELVHRCGFSSRYAGSFAIGVPVLSIHDDEETSATLAAGSIRRSAAGAAALLCLGFTGLAERIARQVGVPVIDPGAAALRLAEVLVDGGYRFSRVSYPVPRKLTPEDDHAC